MCFADASRGPAPIISNRTESRYARRRRFVLQRTAPMTPHPDFRAVVFEDEGHPESSSDPEPRVVVQAVALVDERHAAAVQHPERLRVKHLVQDEGRQLLKIPERFW